MIDDREETLQAAGLVVTEHESDWGGGRQPERMNKLLWPHASDSRTRVTPRLCTLLTGKAHPVAYKAAARGV
eukprot:CAMPEP_0177223998 /NCGR_PEP_ID=MMETSP0367-20130122/38785_1 /TAXON_ID=447022 ORGANISM="Scrippsiella hangoei-like, Strain SHHI-4" /NCGR_SAMPLE_ID=MMETSP0367 /ASSEMBLY_ACC=CAM_ASM_000362 /LENGTH=71 /DNA_ID=CAMNT_0018674009 /DNA_START=320 /DNA_END=532 /DNA_ORIENTATION=-